MLQGKVKTFWFSATIFCVARHRCGQCRGGNATTKQKIALRAREKIAACTHSFTFHCSFDYCSFDCFESACSSICELDIFHNEGCLLLGILQVANFSDFDTLQVCRHTTICFFLFFYKSLRKTIVIRLIRACSKLAADTEVFLVPVSMCAPYSMSCIRLPDAISTFYGATNGGAVKAAEDIFTIYGVIYMVAIVCIQLSLVSDLYPNLQHSRESEN